MGWKIWGVFLPAFIYDCPPHVCPVKQCPRVHRLVGWAAQRRSIGIDLAPLVRNDGAEPGAAPRPQWSQNERSKETGDASPMKTT